MSKTGTLSDGVEVVALPTCAFEGPSDDRYGRVTVCGDVAVYRVVFPDTGAVLHACEEHVQRLWDADRPPADGAVAGTDEAARADHSA